MGPINIEDILTYRGLSGVCYAPGSKTAAFVVSNCKEDGDGHEHRLWLYDGQVRQLTDMGQESSFIWEDEHHLLFPAVRSEEEKKRQKDKDPFTSFYRLDIRGGEAVHAFTLPLSVHGLHKAGGGYMMLGDILVQCPDFHLLSDSDREAELKRRKDEEDYEVLDELPFWLNGAGVINKHRSALFFLDAEGKLTRVTEPAMDVGSLVVMDDKAYYTGTAFEKKSPLFGGAVYCYDPSTGENTLLWEDKELSLGGMVEVDGKLWLTATDGKRHGVNENAWFYTLDPKEPSLKLLRREEYGMYPNVGSDARVGSSGGDSWHGKDGSLYCIATREGNAVLLRISPEGESFPVITKEGSIDAIAISEDTDEALLIAMYDDKLQELYAGDLKTGEVRQLTHFNDKALEGRYVAKPQSLTAKSQGMDIGGWVLLPRDYDPAKTYPAVLDIHGGPKCAYGPVFFHEMQVWASLGYFVFFCNPKGGDGRDNTFADIRGEYGITDYKCIMDFTDAVLEKYPQIDQKRICVTGGSYGGFMTNWIIGHTDRFCCAAAQRSISNWLSFYGVSDIGYFFADDQNKTDFFQSPETLWEHSPVKYAANVKTPTLFIHSDEDYRCPLEQGLQMYTALMARDVPARLCLFHGENHELSRSGKPKHRLRRLNEITNWFETYSK